VASALSRAACSSGSTACCEAVPGWGSSTELARVSSTLWRPVSPPGTGWSGAWCFGDMFGFLPIGVRPESVPEVRQHVGGGLADQAHSRHHLSIVHPGRADHSDRAPHPVGHLVGGEHQAALPKSTARVLSADDDLHVLLERYLLQDAGELGALLEQFQQFLQAADLDELRVAKQVAHTVMQDYSLSLRLVSRDGFEHSFDDAALLAAVRSELGEPTGELFSGLALDLTVHHVGHPPQLLTCGGAVTV